MEDTVVFEREIGIKVGAGEPLADGAPIHQAGVLGVLRDGKGVDHVFDGLLVPGGGVGMGRAEVGGDRQANHVPAVLLGLGVAPAARGRFAAEETIGLGGDDPFDALPQLGVQVVPDQPGAEAECAGPHGRLPDAAPLFAVGAHLGL